MAKDNEFEETKNFALSHNALLRGEQRNTDAAHTTLNTKINA
ncbi:hypothetical protein V6233_22725 [Vibrio antiquarius]